jgi:uncharacterized protein (TIGR02246 family)
MLRTLTTALVVLAGCATSRHGGAECELTPADAAAVRGVMAGYRDAWMGADAKAVLALFTRDAVLLPHHGDDPVVGLAAIERFWWPPGSPTFTLTRMEVTVDEVGGDCRIAHARGSDEIEWSGSGKIHSQRGTYLNVLRKEGDGPWRISHHMWDDPPPQVR